MIVKYLTQTYDHIERADSQILQVNIYFLQKTQKNSITYCFTVCYEQLVFLIIRLLSLAREMKRVAAYLKAKPAKNKKRIILFI